MALQSLTARNTRFWLILGYDVIAHGRPHAATVWGGLFLIATQFIRTTAGATATWIAFARILAQ